MGNIFKVLKRDFLRLFKVPAAWVILFGMVFIPPLYSWYNIVGFWDPYGNTKGITVASPTMTTAPTTRSSASRTSAIKSSSR